MEVVHPAHPLRRDHDCVAGGARRAAACAGSARAGRAMGGWRIGFKRIQRTEPDRGRTPVDLFEHQAKELFAEYGVPVPQGSVARAPEEAHAIAEGFAAVGAPRVVVKAQVKTGGRGKAGGVKLAENPDEAQARAADILSMDIKGHKVNSVLVEEASDIAQEFYLSFLVDRAARTFTSICSVQGGMEIEEVAHTSPAAVAQVVVDPLTGVDGAKAAEIVSAGGLPAEAQQGAATVAKQLW